MIPASCIIATKDRPDKLANLLASLREDGQWPAEVIVVDASSDGRTREVCVQFGGVAYFRALTVGAGAQRNQGACVANQEYYLFADDDVVLEPGCLRALWDAIQSDRRLGGVNALITNQTYHPPGRLGRAFYTWLNGAPRESFAGRIIGPAVNFRVEDRPEQPTLVPVEWLDLGCTLYRREALPVPPFDPFFTDYSYGEDLALSVVVGRSWKLACVPKARIFHDRIKGEIKLGAARFAKMELVNRHFVMTQVLGRRRVGDYGRLVAYELFSLASMWKTPLGRRQFLPAIVGKLGALAHLTG